MGFHYNPIYFSLTIFSNLEFEGPNVLSGKIYFCIILKRKYGGCHFSTSWRFFYCIDFAEKLMADT